MGTEAVLTCTHDLCFEQKLEKILYHIFSSGHYYSNSREIMQYIARTCLRYEADGFVSFELH